ncbi:RNA polymerase sigma factor [Fibrobacterota bacterium]
MTNDQELLQGLFNGDRRDQMEFLRNYTPLLYSIARKVNTRDPSVDFDDLVHEGFLHLFDKDFRRLRGFQFKSKLSTFIFTVVRRHLLSKVARIEKSDSKIPEHAGGKTDPGVEWEALFSKDAEMEYIHRESADRRRETLNRALEGLSEEERLQVRYHIDGYSTERIIKIMGFPNRGVLDKRKYNIIQRMKKAIKKMELEKKHAR